MAKQFIDEDEQISYQPKKDTGVFLGLLFAFFIYAIIILFSLKFCIFLYKINIFISIILLFLIGLSTLFYTWRISTVILDFLFSKFYITNKRFILKRIFKTITINFNNLKNCYLWDKSDVIFKTKATQIYCLRLLKEPKILLDKIVEQNSCIETLDNYDDSKLSKFNSVLSKVLNFPFIVIFLLLCIFFMMQLAFLFHK